MKKTWIFGTLTALALTVAACDAKNDDENLVESSGGQTDEETGGETEGPDATDPTPGQTSGVDETSGGESGRETEPGCSFLGCDTDETGVAAECDLWAQDCMSGEKCMPKSSA